MRCDACEQLTYGLVLCECSSECGMLLCLSCLTAHHKEGGFVNADALEGESPGRGEDGAV